MRTPPFRSSLLVLAILLFPSPAHPAEDHKPNPYFGIRVIDSQSGRGVPLVELRTVNDIVHVTDSAGWVAFHEPSLMNREVYFAITGPGVEYPADGFGFRGTRLTTTPGKTTTVKVKRTTIAERLYRITGQGIYRDSALLGQPLPPGQSNLNTGVLGLDSVQSVLYRGNVFWLWGDTNVANYPLGNFQTTAATSPLPGTANFKPAVGIPLTYFAEEGKPDRVRRMVPFKEPGPVWLFGLLTVPDSQNKDILIAHYSRQKSLAETVEQGLVQFDDDKGHFRRLATLDLKNKWRYPRGNAFRVRQSGQDYYYFASPLAYTRVKATLADVMNPKTYQVFRLDKESGNYQWKSDGEPTTQADEQKLLRNGTQQADTVRYQITEAKTKKAVTLHTASINHNPYRNKWILIGLQQGDRSTPSFLGEVWYAEANSPTGPWTSAVKVATHPNYSFYNVRHHAFMDESGGKVVYFEGTYTRTFSGNPAPTPRYEYNQILYRLDLSDTRLR